MTDQSPIILIGAARSGTKFLRDVLASAEGVKCVPYDVNYIWRYGNESAPDDALGLEHASEKSNHYIANALNSIAGVQNGETLIEKTVSNTLRVKYVDGVFPKARYVHIIRDGRDVVESAMRQWQKKPDLSSLLKKLKSVPLGSSSYVLWFARNFVSGLLKRRGGGSVWGPRFPGIHDVVCESTLAEVCVRQWCQSVERATADLAELPRAEERVITIHYKDLIYNEDTLRALVETLGLPDGETIMQTYRKTCNPSEPEQWRSLLPSDLTLVQQIVDAVEIRDSAL